MNYYKRHIGDYAAKAGHLSMLEHGAYGLLIDAYYNREEGPTRAEAIRIARARTPDELAAVEIVLGEFFDEVDGRFIQTRIEDELAAFRCKQEVNRLLGARGGKANAKRIASETLIEHEADGLANRLANDKPSHKPLAINHEEQDQKPKAGASSAKRGTRLRPDWEPSPDDIAFATSEGVSWKVEADKFRDYWIAKSGAAAAKLDWPATWRNWIRSARRAPITNGGRPNAAANFRGKTYTGTAYEDLPANLRPENVD